MLVLSDTELGETNDEAPLYDDALRFAPDHSPTSAKFEGGATNLHDMFFYKHLIPNGITCNVMGKTISRN